MYNQCRTPCLNVNLSNCRRYFHTALDLILKMANVLNLSLAVTYWQTKLRIESLFCSSALPSGVTWLRTDTELNIPLISSASSSSRIGCIAQLIDCASFLGHQGPWWCSDIHWPFHRLMSVRWLPLHRSLSPSFHLFLLQYGDAYLKHQWLCWTFKFCSEWWNLIRPAHSTTRLEMHLICSLWHNPEDYYPCKCEIWNLANNHEIFHDCPFQHQQF